MRYESGYELEWIKEAMHSEVLLGELKVHAGVSGVWVGNGGYVALPLCPINASSSSIPTPKC